MCFSEEASFVTAGALTVMSFACFYIVRHEKQRYALAVIPFLFALQQAAEGVQWLYFNGIWKTAEGASAARDLFLFIAHAIWPFWIPFSLWLAEGETPRKRWLELFLFLGALLSFYLGYRVIVYPTESYLINQSIFYEVDVNTKLVWPYAAFVTIPWFISSLPRTNFLGAIFLILTLLSYYFYVTTFTSVWCFAAAIMSLALIFVLIESHVPLPVPYKKSDQDQEFKR